MLNIRDAKPSVHKLLGQLNAFEDFCLGKEVLSPSEFRSLNEELSVGTVLMIGSRRYEKTSAGNRLFWKSFDQREYDLGYVRDANIVRDYPGYNSKTSISLSSGLTIESQIIPSPRGKGTVYKVILEDGTEAIAPNYRMAVRNVILKSHLTKKFNHFSLSALWARVWGHA